MDGGRVLLSCALCRQRKLKCDRNVPCSNCVARKTTCVFAPQSRDRGPPLRSEAKQQLDSRIRRLEQSVNSLVSQQSQPQANGSRQRNERQKNERQEEDSVDIRNSSLDIESGQMVSNSDQTIYVSGSHWASICYEVADIREDFDRANQEDPVKILGSQHASGPLLLDGLDAPPDIRSILEDVPPQSVASKLVFRYFNGAEFAAVVVHFPTFEKEYRDFWLRPEDAPIPWVGLLFGLMAMGIFLTTLSNESLPEALGDPVKAMGIYHRRAVQCLILSKYSTCPGPYTLEALLVSQQFEFLRERDGRVGVWLMGGVIIRLAFRMGYHRDASNYPRISVFHGEMRRRMWNMIVHLDALTSYQLGLPAMIQDLHCDTRPPQNLLDDDFGPESTQLPPSRPETEMTPILYSINKARISPCFRTIYSRICLGGSEDYGEVMALHQRLQTARESISPRLRMTSLQDAVTVTPHLLLRRCTLELLFQKTMCMLHRRHMTNSFQNHNYGFSRKCCVEAAMAILEIQSNILDKDKYGYLLLGSKAIISSLEHSDFILAATIVCLELSSRCRRKWSSQDTQLGEVEATFGNDKLLKALRTSHHHLSDLRSTSIECQQAYDVFSLILRRFSRIGDQRSLGDFDSNNEINWSTVEAMLESDRSPSTRDPGTGQEQFSQSHLNTSTIEGFESFFDNPESADWDQWETFMRNSPPDDQM